MLSVTPRGPSTLSPGPAPRRLGFWTVAAMAHLLLVILLLGLLPVVGARSAWVALLVYAPRPIYAAPFLVTVPALARRGARAFLWLPAVTAALVAGPLM